MVPINPELICSIKLIENLIKCCKSEMVHIRHGALYGIAEILLGLAGKSELHNLKDEMKDSVFLRSVNKNE